MIERTQIEAQDNGIVDQDSGLTFTGDELVSMNFWICQPNIFDQITEDLKAFIDKGENLERGEIYLPFVIQAMLQNQRTKVAVIPSESLWFGVTYLDDKEKAMDKLQEMTSEGGYPSPLWPSVRV